MEAVGEDRPPVHRSRTTRARAAAARAGRWLSATSYLKRWIVLGVVIGVVAGLGAVAFYEALVLCTRFFLCLLVGYRVPAPAEEGGSVGSASAARLWLLPAITGMGALVGAFLVFGIAPEAQGHGTDAAISAAKRQPHRAVEFPARWKWRFVALA